MLWLAGQSTLVSILGRGEQKLALALESGARPSWSDFQAVDRTGMVGALASTCNRDLLRSSVSIRLAEFDAAGSDGSAADRARAAGVADLALRELLLCNPIDGNAWLKLATVESFTLGGNDLDRQFIVVSQWSAPSEGWVLRPRLELEVLLLDAGLKRVAETLGSDIRRMAAAGKDGELARLYSAGRPESRAIFDDVIAVLPEKRRKALRALIEDAVRRASLSRFP